MEIIERIKILREQKKVTQDYLSYELGISQEAYSKLERGVSNITIKQVEIICKVFKISLIDLLTSDNIFLKKSNENVMKNNKNYNDVIIDRNKIYRKWEPIIKKYCSDELKYQMLSNFAEKYSYTNDDNLLPLNFQFLTKLKCNFNQMEFDEYDLYKNYTEENISCSKECDLNFSKINVNYEIDMICKLEEDILNKSIEHVQNYIDNNNIFIFQVPILYQIELATNYAENIITMKVKLKYIKK